MANLSVEEPYALMRARTGLWEPWRVTARATRPEASNACTFGAGGAVPSQAPGPGRLLIGAGPVGMRTRMPAVRSTPISTDWIAIALAVAPNPLPGRPPPRPRAIPILTNRAGPADCRAAPGSPDADADSAA